MRYKGITNVDYLLRVFVITFAAIIPLLFYFIEGFKPSISSYWETPLQPIFIIGNATTSYFLYSLKNWKISASMLLLLTAFSITSYPMLHNIFAVCFFLSCLRPLYLNNHYKKVFFYIYLSSLPLLLINLFTFETVIILILCVYHVDILNRLYLIKK